MQSADAQSFPKQSFPKQSFPEQSVRDRNVRDQSVREPSPLELSGIHYRYEKTPVLQDFSLTLRAGEVTLLAAPNGSGKTTALWLAGGLLKPDAGVVRVFGQDPFHQRHILDRVGFLAEGAPLPPTWTAAQVLDFQRGTFSRWDDVLCRELLERFRLSLQARVRTLSRGERGKLALLAMLCTRPELLLLDEPTLGLDVATRRQVTSELLDRLAQDGCTVLISSHEIADAERSADRLVLLQQGKAVCDAPVADLLLRHRLLAWEAPLESPPKALDLLPLPDRMGQRALARRWDAALAAPWLSRGGREAPADLETIYLSLTGEVTHA